MQKVSDRTRVTVRACSLRISVCCPWPSGSDDDGDDEEEEEPEEEPIWKQKLKKKREAERLEKTKARYKSKHGDTEAANAEAQDTAADQVSVQLCLEEVACHVSKVGSNHYEADL